MRAYNLENKRFGDLLVLSRCGVDKTGYLLWLCECSCGKIISVRSTCLVRKKTRSCGCKKGYYIKESLFKGEEHRANVRIFFSVKRSAARRNMVFDLDFNTVMSLVYKDCYYCGAPPNNLYNPPSVDVGFGKYYNGLDRIDSSFGYTVDNVVPSCKQCNTAKLAMPRDEFLSWVDRVYNYQHKERV